MKAPAERTPDANRLVALRKSRGFTNGKAAAQHIREQTGVTGLADSVWASYESGTRKISVKHRAAIEATLGELGRPEPQPAATGDVARLFSMVSDLVEQIKAEREERRAERDELWAMVRRLLDPRDGVKAAPPTTPSALELAADSALVAEANSDLGEAGEAHLRVVPVTPSSRRTRPEGRPR